MALSWNGSNEAITATVCGLEEPAYGTLGVEGDGYLHHVVGNLDADGAVGEFIQPDESALEQLFARLKIDGGDPAPEGSQVVDGVIRPNLRRDFLHDDRILEVVACCTSRKQFGDNVDLYQLFPFEGAILRTSDERHQRDGTHKGQDNSGQQADNSFTHALQLVLRAWGGG